MENISKIIIASDHRGFILKEFIKKSLESTKDILDVGCYSKDSVDYPDVARKLVTSMRENTNAFGIIICGSAIGVSIAVNRASDMRGAVIFNDNIAKSAREHNNANIMCLPADYVSEKEALEFINIFMETQFLGDRHQKRVEMLNTNY